MLLALKSCSVQVARTRQQCLAFTKARIYSETCDCESAYAMHFCSSPTLLSGRWVRWRGLQDLEIPELSQPRALAETCPPVTMQQPTNSTASFERVNCLDEHDFRKLLGFRSRSDCSDDDGLPVDRACAMVPEQKAPIAQPWAVSRTPRQTLPLRGSLAQSRYLQGAKPDSEEDAPPRCGTWDKACVACVPSVFCCLGVQVNQVAISRAENPAVMCLQTVACAPDEGLGCNAAPAQAQQSRVPLVGRSE